MVKPRSALGLVSALAIGLAAAPAGAHIDLVPTLVNRYLTAILSPDAVTVSCAFLFGELPAAEQRRAMDANGDGKIDREELAAERARWRQRASELFSLSIDGTPVLVDAVATVELGNSDETSGAPITVEVGGVVPLPRGEHRLRLEAGRDLPRLGETDLTLDPGPDWTVVASGQGEGAPSGVETRFTFSRPRVSSIEDRSVTFRIRPVAGTARARTGSPATPLVALLLAVGLGAAAAAAWRHRRRSARRSEASM
jgi:hypothetical protein